MMQPGGIKSWSAVLSNGRPDPAEVSSQPTTAIFRFKWEIMSDQKHTPDLKPCPFCGGEASKSTGENADTTAWDYVECLDCGAIAEPDIWNTRTDASEIATLKAQNDKLMNLLIECRRWFLNMSYENMRKHISEEIDAIKAGQS